MTKTYKIEVDCANCANKMELVANKTEGVAEAVVNFMAQKLTVRFQEGVSEAAVLAQLRKNCKKAVGDCEILG